MADDQSKAMQGQESFQSKTPPTAAYVSWFLAQGDTTNPRSPLHRLGTGRADAAAGNHNHRGTDSNRLFDPSSDVVTGDISTTSGQREAIKDILNALAKVGLKDSTTG